LRFNKPALAAAAAADVEVPAVLAVQLEPLDRARPVAQARLRPQVPEARAVLASWVDQPEEPVAMADALVQWVRTQAQVANYSA
jgi:hypothetical protein